MEPMGSGLSWLKVSMLEFGGAVAVLCGALGPHLPFCSVATVDDTIIEVPFV